MAASSGWVEPTEAYTATRWKRSLDETELHFLVETMLVDEIPKHRHGKIVCSMGFLLRHIPERKFTTASTPSTTRPDLPGLVDVEHVSL